MKNLINMGIENLSILPIETLSFKVQKKHEKRFWGHKSVYDHKIDGVSPYTIIRRVLTHNLGKSFDSTFSYFCKLVPKYQQNLFLQEFEDRRCNGSDYFVDDDGNIQVNKSSYYNQWRFRKCKESYTLRFDDFATELIHKVTGHKKSDFKQVYEQVYYEYNRKVKHIHPLKTFTYVDKGYKNGKLLYYEYGADKYRPKPAWLRYRAQDSDFEVIVVKGWEKVFESKNDSEFKKIMAERNQKQKLSRKKHKELMKAKAYDMISKTELQKQKDKELDQQKILAHGFDLITSFRSEKQTNPDLIKLKQ